MRHLHRSFLIGVFAASVTVIGPGIRPAAAAGDQNSVQRLLERGALEEAVQRGQSESDNVESVYFAALALIKMDNNGGAEAQYRRLRESGDESWKAIGESGAKMISGDVDGAMEAGNRAVSANGDNPYAHYQVALVASKKTDFQRAAQGFARAIELKPDFAYAHYYAGQVAQRQRQTPKMAEHFQAFLRLAPDAPERQAVQSILRSLR
jgi:tetratricopeptide (TPR) repeat protein